MQLCPMQVSPMPRPAIVSRTAIAGLAFVAVAGLSGCSWFTKTDEMYAQSEQSRPLEVPPDLDLPRTDAAVGMPQGSVTASQTVTAAAASRDSAPAAATSGFTVPGTRDEVFAQVGQALATVEGLQIASSAELLGAYDVNYQGSNFLVRVSQAEGGVYVSAVDPRGMPAAGAGATQLIATLKATLGGN